MNLLRTLHRRIRARHIAIALVGLAVLLAPALAMAIPGAGEFTTLESPSGRQMAELYNILAKICLVIFIIVCTIMFAAILRFRRRSEDERPEQVHGNMKIEMGILVAATGPDLHRHQDHRHDVVCREAPRDADNGRGDRPTSGTGSSATRIKGAW